MIPPGDFVPVAEETGLIVPLGHFVLEAACRQLRAWRRADPAHADLVVAVNLSARQFQHPTLIDDVRRVLVETGRPPEALKLEITESAAMADPVGAMAMLRTLKNRGVRLAIDDFGAGYAGVSYLRAGSVDAVKIDRSYVADLGRASGDAALVRAVVGFARAMGLAVTAEGVETAAQLAALQAIGCDQGQGYYFARPMAAEALTDVLAGLPGWDEVGNRRDGAAQPVIAVA